MSAGRFAPSLGVVRRMFSSGLAPRRDEEPVGLCNPVLRAVAVRIVSVRSGYSRAEVGAMVDEVARTRPHASVEDLEHVAHLATLFNVSPHAVARGLNRGAP